ncbi:MAG: 30S ribosomal protein S17 [Pseudomonadota bacterium]
MPKRIMEGVVVSTKQDKTAIVKVERTFLHPLLKKIVRRSKKYHAHDEKNVAQEGQTVSIVECAPRSKLKRWELVDGQGDAA